MEHAPRAFGRNFMQKFLSILLVFLIAVGFALPAPACRILRRQDFLSNYEMVKTADAIILAHSRTSLSPDKDINSPHLRFEIRKVIKGPYTKKALDSHVGSTDLKNYRGRSAADDFSRARPGTYAGSCSASDFRLDAEYLLFLKHSRIPSGQPLYGTEKVGDEKWTMGVQLLSRDREEVSGENDPWTQAVMRYAEIASLGDYEKEKIALAELRRTAALGEDAARFPAALVADIDRHFAAASAMKSYADLRAMYDGAANEERRNAAAYAMAAARYLEAFDLILERFGGATVEYFGNVRHPRSAAILAEQFHKRKAQAARGEVQDHGQSDLALLLAGVAMPSDSALMLRALRAANVQDYESEVFARWFVQHPRPETTAVLREIVGKDYSKNWGIAESLARLGDTGIIQWAQRAAQTSNYTQPIYALGYSPLVQADRFAGKIIAGGDAERIEILVYAYRNEDARGNPHRWKRLREIEALKKKQNTGRK